MTNPIESKVEPMWPGTYRRYNDAMADARSALLGEPDENAS